MLLLLFSNFLIKNFQVVASKKFYNNYAVKLIYKLWNNNYVNELFQLKEDMENYVKYSLTGKPIRIKKGVFPHFFDCQKYCSNKKTPTPRPAFV